MGGINLAFDLNQTHHLFISNQISIRYERIPTTNSSLDVTCDSGWCVSGHGSSLTASSVSAARLHRSPRCRPPAVHWDQGPGMDKTKEYLLCHFSFNDASVRPSFTVSWLDNFKLLCNFLFLVQLTPGGGWAGRVLAGAVPRRQGEREA